jgi:hypothetical protein
MSGVLRRATRKAHQHGNDHRESEILEELAEIPGMRPTGRKTATIAIVGREHGEPISSAASIDAW